MPNNLDDIQNVKNTVENSSSNNEKNLKLQELKKIVESKVTIMDVVENYGYATQQVGRDVRIRCPFHPGDKNASLSIQPKTQLYHCFACGESGRGSVEFVQAHEALKNPDFSLTDAIIYISEKFELDIEMGDINELKEAELRERYIVDGEAYSEDKINVAEYNRKLLDIFKLYLLNDSEKSKVQSAIHFDYLKDRGLSLEAIQNFEIGFCPAGALEKMYKSSKDDKLKQFLLTNGLVTVGYNNQVNEFYKDRIMFPIKDTKGNVLGFTGRTLDPRDAAKYKLSKESESFTKSDLLYGYDVAIDRIKKEGKMILLEGNMDVVSSHQLGLTNAVGLNGCSISEKQIKIIKKTGANVVLALDNDNAGHNGIIKIAEQLEENGIKASAIDISDFGAFKDNGDILQASLENPEITNNFKEKYMSLEKNIFEFKLKYEYFASKPINYNTITEIYADHEKNMAPGQKVLFKRFVTQNSEYTKEDINDILSSQEEKKDNFYAEIGMMIINPYLDEKNLTEFQKNLVVSKIIMNPDKVLSMNELSINLNKEAIDILIDETIDKTSQKVKTQALKNEINCREKASEENNKIFTLEGYKELHCELFKNDKDAGKIRTREMAGDNFTKSYEIVNKFNILCDGIMKYPTNASFNSKISFLGKVSNEILCLNAFETKGLGKIERVFIEATAKKLGIEIDFKNNKDAYVNGYKKAVGEILTHKDASKSFSNLFAQISHEDKSLTIQRNDYNNRNARTSSYNTSNLSYTRNNVQSDQNNQKYSDSYSELKNTFDEHSSSNQPDLSFPQDTTLERF